MQLSVIKRVFLVLSCVMIFGFTRIQSIINSVEMKNWAVETDGQFVTPVSTVGIIQSHKTEAKFLTYNDILSMVTQAVEAAGGMESIITDGDSVILKVNLVSAAGQVPYVNGITTDVRVVRAVSELVRQLNPSGWIGVLEGAAPSELYTSDMYDLYNYTKESLAAVDAIICLEDVCGSSRDYNSSELVSISLPDGTSLYPDDKKPNQSRPIYLSKLHYNADVVISIPVLKNHESAALTAGIKNSSIGLTPPSIYALPLWGIPNLRWEIDHTFPNMHKWIHDFYVCRPSDFVIVDGLQGMQHGPGGGSDPKVNARNMRLIMAGRDLIAVDAIAALTVGLDPAKVNYLVYLHNDGLGCADQKLIRVNGNVLVSNVKKKFAHSASTTIAAMYSDFTPPQLSIHTAEIADDSLRLQLDVAQETMMIEIEVDGLRFDKAVINGFDDIRIPIAEYGSGDHEIKVTAYDNYLNASESQTILTSVPKEPSVLASVFALMQNYPNPFNPATTINYSINQTGQVRLTIFNVLGCEVATLVDAVQQTGSYSVQYDGSELSSGVYFYKLDSGSQVSIKKMNLVK